MNYKNRDEFLELIDKLNLKTGCEIGVYKGDYSVKILEKTNLENLSLIDPWKHLDNYDDVSNHDDYVFELIFQDVKNKVNKFGDRVEIIRGLSDNIVHEFKDDELDFIYLDANHSYEASKNDINMWYSKVRPGGIFSGHDYLNGTLPQGEFGVKRAIDEFAQKNNLELHITGEDQWKSWFIIKPEIIKIEENKKYDIVMYCTENYYNTAINLINTLNIFHDNFNIYLYEINFNVNPYIKNVNIVNLTDDRIGTILFTGDRNDMTNHNMFRAIFLKSRVLLHSLTELKLNEVLYLDADILPNAKLDLLLERFKSVKNYPLIQKGPAEYIYFADYDNDKIIGIRGNPFESGEYDETKVLEYPACQLLGIPIQNRTPYSNASVMLYNSNCLEFIKEYDKINESTFNLSFKDIKYYYPFADETTVNVLLWKYNYTNRLPFIQVNINNMNEVKEFYYSYYKNEKIYSVFTKIPSHQEKPQKYLFHGVKNNISKETSDYIENFYFNNNNFKIRYNINENKTYISCDSVLAVKVNFYDWNSNTNESNLLYNTESFFNTNEMWYSFKNLNELKGLKVVISFNNLTIKEENFNFKTINNQKLKKQVVVSHSEVGIGDNLAATPAIKKLSEIYNQKIILLTYIPSAFKNNPYIEEIVTINNNNLQSILNKYRTDDYNINNVFEIMGTNWRMVDHKQVCGYNIGLQLKPTELDMEFYPDPYEEIQNLPEKFICINPSETEPERTWGYKNWQKFIDLIQEHIPVVAIGKETYLDPNLTKKFSNIYIKNGLNLLNHPSQNTLSQAYHIINRSETFVTMNNGLYILSLCNLNNHITELQTSWNTYFYRTRKGIENYNLDYIKGTCCAECLANPKLNIDILGSLQILKSGICYLNKPTYDCHPTPEQVYESVLKKLI